MANQPLQGGSPAPRYIAIAVAVVVVGCGAWYAWGYFETKGAIAAEAGHNAGSSTASGGDRSSANVPPLLGDTNHDGTLSKDELHALDPADVAKVAADTKNLPMLVDAYEPDFDRWRQEIFDQVKGSLTPAQRTILTVPTGPKESYADQDVINQVTLDLADASAQDDTLNGERMLPLPCSPGLVEFPDDIKATETNKYRSADAKDKVPIVNANRFVGPSLPRPTGSFNGVDLSGYSQIRVIPREYVPGPNDPTPAYTRNCQYLWIGLFQATSVPVDSVGAESADGVMSVGRSSSLPLWKIAPARTRATRCGALTARQRACAASISL